MLSDSTSPVTSSSSVASLVETSLRSTSGLLEFVSAAMRSNAQSGMDTGGLRHPSAWTTESVSTLASMSLLTQNHEKRGSSKTMSRASGMTTTETTKKKQPTI